MSNTLKGTIIRIGETQFVGKNRFAKREFVVNIRGGANGEYDNYIKLEMVGDNADRLDNHAVGEDVTVSYNLRGNDWVNKEGKLVNFTVLQAWKIESNGKPSAQPQQSSPDPVMDDPLKPEHSETDDLPF